MSNISRLHSIWDEGGTAVGAWLFLREPILAEAASRAGYDYVCVDLQHGLSTFTDLSGMLQAIGCGGATPLVRVPWNEPWMIGTALDAGALGVIIPMVNSRADAERAVEACRYAPAGSRSIGPVGAMARFGPTYFQTANDRVLCIVMIETVAAVACIDDILNVPGIDAVYLGPADLSLTLGLPPGVDSADPRFTEALSAVVESCTAHNVVPGIHTSASLAGDRHDRGFRMVSVSYDQQPVMLSLANDLDTARHTTERKANEA